MTHLDQDSLKQLLQRLQETIQKFINSYQKDKLNKVKSSVAAYITIIKQGVLVDISNDIQKENLTVSMTTYDEYVDRLDALANEMTKKSNGLLFNDDELKDFSDRVTALTSKTLVAIKSEFEQQQKVSGGNNNNDEDFNKKFEFLTKKMDEMTLKFEGVEKDLKIAQQQVTSYQTNLGQLGQIFSMLTIEVNDNVTFETLKSVLPLLNLPLPKAITNGAGAEDTKAIYYYPFKNEFPEKELAIEGLSFDPIKDKASLTDWRKNNQLGYEILKLSQCTYADMYAAIRLLANLLKKHTSQNASAHFKPDQNLITAIKKVLDGLLENAQQNWQFCKETVISPVLDNAPAELKPVLTRILAFDHANTLDHCVWYVGSSARQQAMASLVAYPDLNEETHFLPKMTLTAQKIMNPSHNQHVENGLGLSQ